MMIRNCNQEYILMHNPMCPMSKTIQIGWFLRNEDIWRITSVKRTIGSQCIAMICWCHGFLQCNTTVYMENRLHLQLQSDPFSVSTCEVKFAGHAILRKQRFLSLRHLIPTPLRIRQMQVLIAPQRQTWLEGEEVEVASSLMYSGSQNPDATSLARNIQMKSCPNDFQNGSSATFWSPHMNCQSCHQSMKANMQLMMIHLFHLMEFITHQCFIAGPQCGTFCLYLMLKVIWISSCCL